MHSSSDELLQLNGPTLSVLQAFVIIVQQVVARWEGTVARLLQDDKVHDLKLHLVCLH